MASHEIQSEPAMPAQDRDWLEGFLARFLDRIESEGATSAELAALRTIVGSGDKEASARLEALSGRMRSALHAAGPGEMALAKVARLRGVKVDTLRRSCWSGKLPGEKRGKTWFVHISDLERYLSGQPPQGGDPPMLDNVDSAHRQELMRAIRAAGLAAGELEPDDDMMNVIMILL